ncbi:MAG TPA: TolC family protein [Fibrobacteraceae bacterium]|nr:TolC family protein [Fibrobacteraceae bacterium]
MKSFVLLFCCSLSVHAADVLSLRAALDRMELGNASLRAGQERVHSADFNHRASLGNFLPVLKLDMSAQHLDRDLVMDLDGIRSAILQLQAQDAATQQNLAYALQGQTLTEDQLSAIESAAYDQYDAAIPHFLDTLKTQNYWLGSLSLYQPLFYGGRIYAGERISAARQKAARSDQKKQAGDLRRDFVKLYLQGALLRSSIALRIDALAAMRQHRDRAAHLVEQGMADRTALLRAELAIAEGQTALSDDSVKLSSIAITLGQMVGSPDPVEPAEAMANPPSLPPDLSQLEKRVQDRNPLVQSLNAQAEVAKRAIAVRNADFLPEIGAFGKYELNQSALSDLEPKWVVGIKGSVTLFHGGVDWNNRASAQATQREVLALRDEATSAIQAQVRRKYLALSQARLRYENEGRQEDLARETHRVTDLRFNEGQSTSLEVVDSWLALQKVQLERLSTACDAWMALLEIAWAEGTTNEFTETWQGAQR